MAEEGSAQAPEPEAQPAAEVVEETPAVTRGKPAFMDGFCHFLEYRLQDPVTDEPLASRHIEIIIVNGDVDPPYSDGDDRIQDVTQDFNSERERKWMNMNPGLIEALFTIFVEKTVPDDTRAQLWEKVILRIYNNDEKELATHYVDSEIWECQPGFISMTPDLCPMGSWRKIARK